MTPKLKRNTLLCLTCAYVALIAALTVLNRIGADRWWFGSLNLYLPQAMWAAPGVILAVFSLKAGRYLVWAQLLCVVWVFGPIMGLCWPLHPVQDSTGKPPIRVMTWNVKYGAHDTTAQAALVYHIDGNRPDVVLLQDATNILDGPLGDYFRNWHVRSDGQYVIASRFPLSEMESLRISTTGVENCVRCRLRIGATSITLYNVHFQSPREGLSAFMALRKRPRHLPEAVKRHEDNVDIRLSQARAVRDFIKNEKGPVIVAGDLNSADPSLVCATLRDGGLHDAFAEGGRGYGYTYGHYLLQHRFPWLKASWMRIDHIMVNPQLRALRCWTGPLEASDHRPVIADLAVQQ